MKLRATVSVLAIVAALTACSSSAKNGSPSVANTAPAPGGGAATSVTGGGGSAGDFCARLQTDTSKLGNLSNAGTAGNFNALKAQLGQDISTFQDLANGAPAQVKPALDDIVTELKSAQQAVADPSNPDVSQLSALATKLPADITQLTSYVTANCH